MPRLLLALPEPLDPDRTLDTLGKHLRSSPDGMAFRLEDRTPLLQVPLGTPGSSALLRQLQRLLDDLRREAAAPRLYLLGDGEEFRGPGQGHRELSTDRPLEAQVSAGGSCLQAPGSDLPARLSAGDPDLIRAMGEHVARHVGPVAFVVHEPRSPYVHVDIHVVAPRAERPCWTLVTSGLAELPMRAPSLRGQPFELQWAELALSLPADWTRERLLGWPVEWLRELARYPHRCDTWLGWGHTVPFLGGATIPGSAFCGAMLMKPVSLSDPFHCFRPGGVRHLHVYALYPLTPWEMNYKLEHGAEALARAYGAAGHSDVVNLARPCLGGRANRAQRRRRR